MCATTFLLVHLRGRAGGRAPPGCVVVYVRRGRGELQLVLNLRSALWLPGCKWFSCGAFGPPQKMEPLTHTVICRCDTWESERVATDQRYKLELAADMKWGQGTCTRHGYTHADREHVSFRVLWFYRGGFCSDDELWFTESQKQTWNKKPDFQLSFALIWRNPTQEIK